VSNIFQMLSNYGAIAAWNCLQYCGMIEIQSTES